MIPGTPRRKNSGRCFIEYLVEFLIFRWERFDFSWLGDGQGCRDCGASNGVEPIPLFSEGRTTNGGTRREMNGLISPIDVWTMFLQPRVTEDEFVFAQVGNVEA